MEHEILFLILAGGFGLFMAWGIGANDVANAMATSVGSKAISIRTAIIIAAIFEFAGAFLAGGEVTATIRKGILETGPFIGQPELLVFGMLSALLASGIWLMVATHYGLPVSTTHSIVGAIVGFAVIGVGISAVHWSQMAGIVASWVISPLMAGTLSYLLFISIQRLILDKPEPLKAARRYAPLYMFLSGFILALVTLVKGLTHLGLDLPPLASYGIAVGVGLLTVGLGFLITRRIQVDPQAEREFHYASVERVFASLMVMTACTMAFAHGSNDVANAIGPVAAVVSVAQTGNVTQASPLANWILILGGVGIVLGLLTFGQRVIATVGTGITTLTPSRGFACEIAAAITVVIASGTGLPISTTQVLVGAVMGVGLARGIAALNMPMIRQIMASWVITVPAGGILAAIFFLIFKALFT